MNLYLLTSAVGTIAFMTSPAAYAVSFTPPAHNTAPQVTPEDVSRSRFFTPPPDIPVPQRAAGGASRGRFFTAPRRAAGGAARGDPMSGNEDGSTAASLAMLGLMPQSFDGTRIAAHPAILVYLPASDAQEAVFSLKDEKPSMFLTQPWQPCQPGARLPKLAAFVSR
jgi:Domain of Unknown Function (DUF928)